MMNANHTDDDQIIYFPEMMANLMIFFQLLAEKYDRERREKGRAMK